MTTRGIRSLSIMAEGLDFLLCTTIGLDSDTLAMLMEATFWSKKVARELGRRAR